MKKGIVQHPAYDINEALVKVKEIEVHFAWSGKAMISNMGLQQEQTISLISFPFFCNFSFLWIDISLSFSFCTIRNCWSASLNGARWLPVLELKARAGTVFFQILQLLLIDCPSSLSENRHGNVWIMYSQSQLNPSLLPAQSTSKDNAMVMMLQINEDQWRCWLIPIHEPGDYLE